MAKIKVTSTKNKKDEPEKKNAKSSQKTEANAKKVDKKDIKTNDKPQSERILHQILPFVWFVIAAFLLICILLRDVFMMKGDANLLGPVGEGIHMVFFGLLGWGAFLVPFVFIYLGIMWRKLVDRHRVVLKLLLASFIVLSVSAFAQVCVSDATYPGFQLWSYGAELVGGGLIGGSLGWLCYAGLKIVGSALLLWALILVLVCLLVDATPRNIWLWVRYKNKIRKERIERDRARYAEEQEQKRLEREQKLSEEDSFEEPRRKLSARRRDALEAEVAPDIPEDLEDATIVGESKKEFVEDVFDAPADTVEPTPEPAPEADVKKVETQKVFADPTELQLQADDGDDSAPFIDVESDNMFNLPEEPEEEEAVIPWVQPPLDLLNADPGARADQSESIAETKTKLLRTLESFGVRVKGIGYSVGPTITRYEVVPEAGVRVKQIANLVDDIAMSLATVGVRIEAPIPNKPAVGVEVPNDVRANVYLKTLIDDDQFWNSSPLTVCLGQDVAGKNVYFDIKKMPHMIIAGTTGAGKSVCINCLVCSLLYKNPADKVKLIMIDPKKVEFTMYQHIPHLYCPIISDPRKAAGALASAVTEMERRYTLVEDVGVRDIDSYNKVTANDPDREYLPKLIIIIDELADLMMTAKQDVELFITRIAQKARAVGIHLVIGTQRPSVDVITGLIKANVPSRIACTVKSQVDSRTIIDISGAEKLIGRGDMLFSPVGMAKPMRVQGAFLEDDEVRRVVDFIKDNNEPVVYNNSFMDNMEAAAASMEADGKKGGGDFTPADGGGDDKFRQALEVAVNEGKISTSLLQRKLSIGYGKAAKIIDEMEEAGFVSPPDGNKPRRVLMTKQEFYEKALNDELPTSGD